MLAKKHFKGNDYFAQSQLDFEVLGLLNQKVQEDPDYPLPEGFKKVNEVKYVETYQVPALLNMKESEKIALEVLD